MLGVARTRVGVSAWAMAGGLAGLSGLLIADLIRLDAGTLTFVVVPAIAAAVIGRLESLPITLLGGLAIGTLESTLAPIDSLNDYRGAAPFVVALVVMAARSRRTATTRLGAS